MTAAAITTCGASIFMIPNYMTPFVKIGMFICFDIVVSLLFAVFMFAGMLSLCGPKDRNHCRIDVRGKCGRGNAAKVEGTQVNKENDVAVEMVHVNPGRKRGDTVVVQAGTTATPGDDRLTSSDIMEWGRGEGKEGGQGTVVEM